MVMETVNIYITLHDNVDCVFVFYFLLLLLKFINFVPSILFISIYFFMVMNITVMMNAQNNDSCKNTRVQPVSE